MVIWFTHTWRELSDSQPVVALMLFTMMPLILAPIIVYPIYRLFWYFTKITYTKNEAIIYLRFLKSDFNSYVRFLSNSWRCNVTYAACLFIILLFEIKDVIVRDSLIIIVGILITAGFYSLGKKELQFKYLPNVFVIYFIYLLVAIAPFMAEIEGRGNSAFNRWYSFSIVLFPVASTGLLLAIRRGCASRVKTT